MPGVLDGLEPSLINGFRWIYLSWALCGVPEAHSLSVRERSMTSVNV